MVRAEYEEAAEKFPAFHSAHEGYGVILEEMDELWTVIKDKNLTHLDMKYEAVQVAAMDLRFIIDLCGPRGRVFK